MDARLFADADLPDILSACHRLLSRGVADRRSPFHTPALATAGLDGAPRIRTVVLRAYDPLVRTLRFHTDLRSGKVEELRRHASVALHAYDPGAKLQLRLDGRARIHAWPDPLAVAAWDASKPMSRACYATDTPPGVPVGVSAVTRRGAGDGREHFAVVAVALGRLEFLWLAHTGHRRGLFQWTDDRVDATWLAP